jgi:hypothetical protein
MAVGDRHREQARRLAALEAQLEEDEQEVEAAEAEVLAAWEESLARRREEVERRQEEVQRRREAVRRQAPPAHPAPTRAGGICRVTSPAYPGSLMRPEAAAVAEESVDRSRQDPLLSAIGKEEEELETLEEKARLEKWEAELNRREEEVWLRRDKLEQQARGPTQLRLD